MNQLSNFYRKLGGMLEAGMPIVSALATVSSQVKRGPLRMTVLRIGQEIERGELLHDALRGHPKVFSSTAIAMVRSGQSAGRLAETFKELAILEEKRAAIRSRIRRAMAYPCFVVFFALVIAGASIFFILPVFEGLYEGEGTSLPATTLFLIGSREFLHDHWLLSMSALASLVVVLKMLRMSAFVRTVTDGLMLYVPIVGGVIRKIAIARFTRSLSHLVRNGLGAEAAIRMSAGAVSNQTLSLCLANAADAASRGETLSTALAPTNVLPADIINMLKSGEKSSRSDEMLENIAAYTEDEVDAKLKTLTSLIQPILVIIVGGLVALLAVGLLSPIFNLANLV